MDLIINKNKILYITFDDKNKKIIISYVNSINETKLIYETKEYYIRKKEFEKIIFNDKVKFFIINGNNIVNFERIR